MFIQKFALIFIFAFIQIIQWDAVIYKDTRQWRVSELARLPAAPCLLRDLWLPGVPLINDIV